MLKAMETIKIELDKFYNVCKGCLSADRRVHPLGDYSDLFFYMLGDHRHTINETKDLAICWECLALLKKAKTFQTQIRTAQIILMNALYEHNTVPISLSTLSTSVKDHFDYTISYKRVPEEVYTKDIKDTAPAEIKLERTEYNASDVITKDEEFVYDDCAVFDADLFENNYDEPQAKHTSKESVVIKRQSISCTENDADFPKNNFNIVKSKHNSKESDEIKIQSIKNYEKFATISKINIVDRDNLKKYYVRVYLSEKEMDSVLLERQHHWGLYKSLHKCDFCDAKYNRTLDLKRHTDLQHNQSTGPYPCSECQAILRSPKSLVKHWRSHTQMLRCTICTHLSRSRGEVRKHLNRAHTSQYTCVTCGAQAGTLREFSNHFKKMHERLVCDHCQRGYTKKSSLEKHIIRNHLPAKCELCRRTYAHYHVLENHYRMYHPELVSAPAGPELAYCVECDKQFGSVYRYKRHIAQSARHTPQKRVRVPCPECGKVFSRTTYMNNHYRLVHVKDTKHCCDLCNKFFSTGYAMRKHRQYVHEKILMPKNKICDICGRGFGTNRILTNHRRTHTGERPFKCEYCPATFAQQTAMKTHQKTQHKSILN